MFILIKFQMQTLGQDPEDKTSPSLPQRWPLCFRPHSNAFTATIASQARLFQAACDHGTQRKIMQKHPSTLDLDLSTRYPPTPRPTRAVLNKSLHTESIHDSVLRATKAQLD
jgi:hypothetical protein